MLEYNVTSITERRWNNIKAMNHELDRKDTVPSKWGRLALNYRQTIISMWKNATWISDRRIYCLMDICCFLCYAATDVWSKTEQGTDPAEKTPIKTKHYYLGLCPAYHGAALPCFLAHLQGPKGAGMNSWQGGKASYASLKITLPPNAYAN